MKSSAKERPRKINLDVEVLGISEAFSLNKAEDNIHEVSVSHCSELTDSINQELDETDQTKLQNHFSINITDSNSSFKWFSSLNSMQKHNFDSWKKSSQNENSWILIKTNEKQRNGKKVNSIWNTYMALDKENLNFNHHPKSRYFPIEFICRTPIDTKFHSLKEETNNYLNAMSLRDSPSQLSHPKINPDSPQQTSSQNKKDFSNTMHPRHTDSLLKSTAGGTTPELV
jgi:hypothetical protein